MYAEGYHDNDICFPSEGMLLESRHNIILVYITPDIIIISSLVSEALIWKSSTCTLKSQWQWGLSHPQ